MTVRTRSPARSRNGLSPHASRMRKENRQSPTSEAVRSISIAITESGGPSEMSSAALCTK